MKTLQGVSFAQRSVLVSTTLDVPITAQGKLRDPFRLERAAPTIRRLLAQKARVVLVGHRGQPHGRRVARLSTRLLLPALRRLLKCPVVFVPLQFAQLKRTVQEALPGSCFVLENIRFAPGEEKNDQTLAKRLASVADAYVNEDFATSHRKHASLASVPKYLPSYAGLNLVEEVRSLTQLRSTPRRPFLIILGGAKVKDKLGVVEALLRRTHGVLVGGVAATTVLHAQGYNVGASLLDTDISQAKLRRIARSKKLFLPTDFAVARTPHSTKRAVVSARDIPPELSAFDVGPESIQRFLMLLEKAKTVFWAGTLGYVENPVFAQATNAIARGIPASTFSVVGGGDTIGALTQAKLAKRFSFLSTGGSATLQFLAGVPLPALTALEP